MVLPDASVKLTDFGIAKDLDVTEITAANCTVGTASYMSPEQCRGERKLTNKSDLYSLGIVFYELLTGKKPFQAETPMEMFMLHVEGTFERPSRVVLDIPVWLDTLVCQLLEKTPEKRPLDAATVALALEQVKEKVEAQQSAGVEAAKRRAIDRPKDQPALDASDKDAARNLLQRKPKKKRAKPLYQQKWFQGVGSVAGLVLIGFVIWLVFIKKPSPDGLYQAAQEALKSKNADTRKQARDGPIAQFLLYYGDRKDDQAKEMRDLADKLDREDREVFFLDRMRGKTDVGVDADERNFRQAVEAEDSGDLDGARKSWKQLLKYKQEQEGDKRAFYLIATDRIKRLGMVELEEKKLQGMIDSKGHPTASAKSLDDFQRQALLALSHEAISPAKGRESWNQLKAEMEPNKDKETQRPWFVLAAKRLRGLPEPKKEVPTKSGALLPRTDRGDTRLACRWLQADTQAARRHGWRGGPSCRIG
jgi:serine/threonine-protein kinase